MVIKNSEKNRRVAPPTAAIYSLHAVHILWYIRCDRNVINFVPSANECSLMFAGVLSTMR